MTRPRCHQRAAKKQRGQCLTLTALKWCLAAPYCAFAGHRRAFTGTRKYYYGLLATKFQPTTIWRILPIDEGNGPLHRIALESFLIAERQAIRP